jgi:glycosyltransferase involved in cell wall biosynthesis
VAVVTVGLAIIARDEEETLPRLLASAAGAFDQVALLDTGSEDRTVEIFEEWAGGQDLPLGHRVGRFEWRDDFAAARNAADALLTSDWIASADADEVILDAAAIRRAVSQTPDGIHALAFDHDGGGVGERSGPAVRATRRGRTTWSGRTHAVPVLNELGGKVRVFPGSATWVNTRSDREGSRERDRRIVQRWLREEPNHPQALGLGAADALELGKVKRAARLFGRYLDLPATAAALGAGRLATARSALRRLEATGPEPGIAHEITFGSAA